MSNTIEGRKDNPRTRFLIFKFCSFSFIQKGFLEMVTTEIKRKKEKEKENSRGE